MAFDAFLKIDGIDGESQDKVHKGEIEIELVQLGRLRNRHRRRRWRRDGQGRRRRTSTSRRRSARPRRCLAMLCDRSHIKAATLTVRKAGGDRASSS